jgi:hypothetical protein
METNLGGTWMNDMQLRKESEPPLHEVLDELNRLTREMKETREWPVDFLLIQRVMHNEIKREKEKQILCHYKRRLGQHAKPTSSLSSGKKVGRAPTAACTTATSKQKPITSRNVA